MSILKFLGYILGRKAEKGKVMGKNNEGQRIATAVTEYVNDHIDREFTAKELRFHVIGRVEKSAPASADRIMRMLRKEGKINYVLVKRQLSLYRGLSLEPKADLIAGDFPTDLGNFPEGHA